MHLSTAATDAHILHLYVYRHAFVIYYPLVALFYLIFMLMVKSLGFHVRVVEHLASVGLLRCCEVVYDVRGWVMGFLTGLGSHAGGLSRGKATCFSSVGLRIEKLGYCCWRLLFILVY